MTMTLLTSQMKSGLNFLLQWCTPSLFLLFLLFKCVFSVFSNKHHYNFNNKYVWKNVHLVNGAGIQTHDLENMNLLPQPLDQGSRLFLLSFGLFNDYIFFQRFNAKIIHFSIWPDLNSRPLNHESDSLATKPMCTKNFVLDIQSDV